MDNTIDNTDDLDVRVPEIVIDEKNPFLNDKLGRDFDVKTMTKIVEAFKNGAVISVNGEWGTGKTTFLKIWKQHLINNGFPVIYYNAWEDDISEEPLFSMVKSLRSLVKDESAFDKIAVTAGKFIVGALFGALKGAAGIWGNVIGEGVKGGTKILEDECIDSLKSKDSTSSLLEGFKDSLVEYVEFVTSMELNIPIVYFVDELDRCNPTFAVKVLERIKHLFDVNNIVFVLAIDKEQLCHSINGYFGSEGINSEEYLRRFINLEYSIRPIQSKDYCIHLIQRFHLDEAIGFSHNLSIDGEEEPYSSFFNACCITFGLGCRQIEKVFSLFTVAYYCLDNLLYETKTKLNLNLCLLFYLATLKIRAPKLFDKIDKCIISEQELIDEIEELYLKRSTQINDSVNYYFNDVFARLISYYFEYRCGIGYYQTTNKTDLVNDIHLKFRVFQESSVMDAIRIHLKRAKSRNEQLYYYINQLKLVNSFEREQYEFENKVDKRVKKIERFLYEDGWI